MPRFQEAGSAVRAGAHAHTRQADLTPRRTPMPVPAPGVPVPGADAHTYLLYLQRTAGNRAVNALLQQAAAQRQGQPATVQRQGQPGALVQRAVWQKNVLTDQVEQVGEGPQAYQVPLEVLNHVLYPGDRYDEATGIITRLMGEQVHISALLPAIPQQTQPQPGEYNGPGGFPFPPPDAEIASCQVVEKPPWLPAPDYAVLASSWAGPSSAGRKSLRMEISLM